MAKDDLYPDGKEPTADDAKGDDKPKGGDEVAQLTQNLGTLTNAMATQSQQLNAMGQYLESITQDAASDDPPGDPTPNPDDDKVGDDGLTTWQKELLSDREKGTQLIKDIVDRELKARIEPELQKVQGTQVGVTIHGLRRKFDIEHGAGQFDKVISPFLQQAVNTLKPEAQTDPRSLAFIYNAILGSDQVRTKLPGLASAEVARLKEARGDSSMLGANRSFLRTGRQGPRRDQLDDIEKAVITEINAKLGDGTETEASYLDAKKRLDHHGRSTAKDWSSYKPTDDGRPATPRGTS